ncbi:DMT family transporter [Dongia sp.]|jgi:drug/metabolite transporter (DMT)-like permease|uniref:DMT family transporter n=1 Tax=Dongia sp. TaxID=1977262 RepID=UPI0035B4D1E2
MTPPTTKALYRAMLFMAFGVFWFSVLDAVTKQLTEGYGTWQISATSRIITLAVMTVMVLQRHRSVLVLRSSFIKTHMLRSLFIVATTWTFFECLRYLELADAIAIAFAAPLFITAMSGPVLGENVGWRRWTAVVVGFVGVIVAVEPGRHGVSWGALLALIAAITYAIGQLWLRPLAGREQGHNIVFYGTLFSGLIVLGPAIYEWKWPVNAFDWMLFLVQGSCSTLGQICMVRAFRVGEASLLAPLEYTALVWAGLFGYLFWGDLPTLQVLVGAVIIIGASLYIARREAIKRGAAS